MSAIHYASYPSITFASKTLGCLVEAFYEAENDVDETGSALLFYLVALRPARLPDLELIDVLARPIVEAVEAETLAELHTRIPEPQVVEHWELEDLPF